MTSFSKNPYTEARRVINRLVFRSNLNKTLDSKFKHKQFSERFSIANGAFISLGFIAQMASMTTAFVMLSYLFVSTPVIIRVVCSVVLVLAIEIIKRQSTDDVMQGLCQYKEVERFSIFLTLIAISSSIYIAIEGAQLLPSLLVMDATEKVPEYTSDADIKADYEAQKMELVAEREEYKASSKWQGRIAGKDRKVVQQFNDRLAALQVKKDSALQALVLENEAKHQATLEQNELERAKTTQERSKLGDQLVLAAIVFELLFLLSMCFSWWYYVECEKERQETRDETSSKTVLPSKAIEEKEEKTSEELVGVRAVKKMSFKDYEVNPAPIPPEKKGVKKEYTRICPQCKTPFVHKNHNHTYCTRDCYLNARRKNSKSK